MRYLIAVVVLFSFNCEDSVDSPQDLQASMNAIEAQINTLVSNECGAEQSCKAAPIGAKPCGGPTHYIIYASVTDANEFHNLIARYNELNIQLNKETGAISDCAIVNPPELVCESGICREKE